MPATHCVVLGVAPGFRCRSSRLGSSGHSCSLNTVVSGERERWKYLKGDIHWGCWVGVVKAIAIYSVDMGYMRWGLQGGGPWKMGAEQGTVDGGGCERRDVVCCSATH